MVRVFSKEWFGITFSNTRAQDDETLAFKFEQDRTTLTGSQDKIWDEPSIFEFGKLNEFTIDFSNNSILFTNKKLFRSLVLHGMFEHFIFVGFSSESLATWIVLQSMILLKYL